MGCSAIGTKRDPHYCDHVAIAASIVGCAQSLMKSLPTSIMKFL